jgi:glycosyltransferase involved in cell wall biosynthesis
MRVCLFNHNVAWSGGTFVRCLALGHQLAIRGHRVTLVTTSQTARWSFNRLNRNGVDIVESPAVLRGRLRSGWDLVDTLRRLAGVIAGEFGEPDIVHAFDSRPTVILPALMLADKFRAPLVMDWADWWGRGGTIESRDTGELMRFLARGPETWFEEAFRSRAKQTTVISTALAERAQGLGVPEASITVLPQGCDVDSINPVEVGAARRRCALPEGIPMVGYEGTLLKEDAPLLLNSFIALRAADERIRLLLIGNPQFPIPEVPGLVRTGFVPKDRLSDYLGACDFFLLPLYDTVANRARWPSKINDYMAAGRPTVATPVGDIKRLFSRHEVGFVGCIEDGSFLTACSALLSDPDARARLGRNARTLAETELSWSTIGETLVSVYKQAMTSDSSHGQSW